MNAAQMPWLQNHTARTALTLPQPGTLADAELEAVRDGKKKTFPKKFGKVYHHHLSHGTDDFKAEVYLCRWASHLFLILAKGRFVCHAAWQVFRESVSWGHFAPTKKTLRAKLHPRV